MTTFTDALPPGTLVRCRTSQGDDAQAVVLGPRHRRPQHTRPAPAAHRVWLRPGGDTVDGPAPTGSIDLSHDITEVTGTVADLPEAALHAMVTSNDLYHEANGVWETARALHLYRYTAPATPDGWTPAYTMLDDLGPYPCLADGTSCNNGYGHPRITLATAHRVAADIAAQNAHFGGCWSGLRITGDTITVLDNDGEFAEECHPGPDGTYAIGHGYWVWTIH
ncbi:hypothetical protein [Kitasatospora sp. NPDC059160]|uniref:hypothetical protein n=1 Tax=Kitasatospora sp. NPDC059160 TaxID=3346748 RepID=UPI00367F489A